MQPTKSWVSATPRSTSTGAWPQNTSRITTWHQDPWPRRTSLDLRAVGGGCFWSHGHCHQHR
ncbi:unnamed protein product [Symbiodinium sp. CCMP2456]|nr:unnamed protein product [Symbiodinium sp. CCMP2456]